MKKHILLLVTILLSATMISAEVVKLNGLYYSLGSTTASVVSDQSSDKSTYASYTSVTIPASATTKSIQQTDN